MHAKSSHKRQTALGHWTDVGHLKNRKLWQFFAQFVADGVSSQLILTGRCKWPVCFDELVHELCCTLRPELYVILRYTYIRFIYIDLYVIQRYCHFIRLQTIQYCNEQYLIKVKRFFICTYISSLFRIIYLLQNITTTFISVTWI